MGLTGWLVWIPLAFDDDDDDDDEAAGRRNFFTLVNNFN